MCIELSYCDDCNDYVDGEVGRKRIRSIGEVSIPQELQLKFRKFYLLSLIGG